MWLYVPIASTSSAFAPEAEDSTSASSWQSQLLAQSCAWRGKQSQSRDWQRRWKKALWLQRLYGLMSEPSTAAHGVELWMASLAASRASLTPLQASSSERKTNATSGQRPAGSLFRPGHGSSSSRTSKACSTLVDLNGCVGTFDAFVSRLRLDYSVRQNVARRTSATAFSSSPWPRPKALSGGPNSKRSERGAGGPDLQEVAIIWSTPRASDAEKGGPNQSFGAGGIPLPAQATAWATPTLNGNHNRKGLSESSGDGLSTMAVQWPTPTSLSFDGSHQPGNSRSMNATLDAASSLRRQMTSTDGATSSNSGRSLNQRFVGWLMGWLDGWTSFECSATELSRFKRRMRFALSQLALHDAPPAQNDLFA